MDGPRKRVNKYGRMGRKALIHDLFDNASHPDPLCTTLQPSPADSLAPSRDKTPVSDISEDPDVSMQLNNELLAEWDANRPRLKSPARKLLPEPMSTTESLFDIESSEEEHTKTKPILKTYKRRKITPTGSDVEERGAKRDSTEITQQATRGIVAADAARLSHGLVANNSSKGENTLEPKSKMLRKKHDSGMATLASSQSLQISRKPKPKVVSRASTPPPRTPTDVGSPASDISASSMATTRSASKRKREALDGPASDVSSPSQLELTSLRLTPQRHGDIVPRSNHVEQDNASIHGPPRIRRRLIDRLEGAKSHQSDDDGTQMRGSPDDSAAANDPTSNRSHSRGMHEIAVTPPTIKEHEANQHPSDTVKPRKYGKQRSHLRDMAGELDSQQASQQSVDELVSQIDALTNSQQSQLDFDMSDDDDSVQLKSIHELRQAGAVNRYDRDLDSLLEDIASPTKAVRITGLMQLVRKLKEQAFKRHLLDQGKVARITDCIRAEVDIISASIMLLAFWTLAHSEAATGQLLNQLYQGILQLPANLLQEGRPLSKIAKDRGENLSRALIGDLAEFEHHVLDQSASAGRQTSHIIISRIGIRAVEVMLRKLIASGDSVPPTPAPWLEAAMKTIASHQARMGNAPNGLETEHTESIRLLLAWLELSEASNGSIGKKLSRARVAEFGRQLGELLSWARSGNAAIQHSCLKLVIELGNQKDSITGLLASVGLSGSVFAIVEEHFPRLADRAVAGSFKDEDDADSDKLSSVILALGCLLDFVDSSEQVRVQMMESQPGEDSRVDRLVTFFKLYVDETDEAIDESKTAILIPFGYISLLLCTLSLNANIRQHISATIGRSFEDVMERAATFLERMRSINPDAAFVERFVERFNLTIESVKSRRS
ncbi:uncharacterized protein HMPREF1541_04897 [Cyphellophora europaea CBS 101466]|uniref:Wings apart-like protein C-terminal domain-containing protein n=1 Tax=Cyphellophora europaea (strain CBS 101466) TaxID=1220924 RepID=W2RWC3_CYPE1|nr:uncharacterized protein HMPREF1541_04897 [Cyphellophora europaea CBS 101466]ETN40620.1 hypothetical protein HMPREF1541_04897 [Cyphellophora europaea CBS 101466]